MDYTVPDQSRQCADSRVDACDRIQSDDGDEGVCTTIAASLPSLLPSSITILVVQRLLASGARIRDRIRIGEHEARQAMGGGDTGWWWWLHDRTARAMVDYREDNCEAGACQYFDKLCEAQPEQEDGAHGAEAPGANEVQGACDGGERVGNA